MVKPDLRGLKIITPLFCLPKGKGNLLCGRTAVNLNMGLFTKTLREASLRDYFEALQL